MKENLKPILSFAAVLSVLIAISIIQQPDTKKTESGENTVVISGNISPGMMDDIFNTELRSEPVYADSKEAALLAVDMFDNYPYMQKVDEIIWEDENDEYAVMYYHSIKKRKWEGTAICKFKVRETEGKKQYALININIFEARTNWGRAKPLDTVKNAAPGFDMMAQYSIVDGKRFFWGSLGTEKAKTLKIEGESPTAVIEHTVLGEPEYFWYYEDIDSDKPSRAFTIEMEE